MDNNWLTIENIDGEVVLTECSKEAEGEIVIPEGVTKIGDKAFGKPMNGVCLTSVHIPKTVKFIGDMAFTYSSLTSIVVDKGNPVFDSRDDCNAIIETATNTLVFGFKETVIPNSVTSIKKNAFHDENLTSIVIPQSVTVIECNAFSGLNHLTSIVVDENNKVYDSRNNCNAIVETATNTLIKGCRNTIIPNTITSIGEKAFSFCLYLESIEIPNGVKSIGLSAFSNCPGLAKVDIPDSVTSIDDGAFACCHSLKSIALPKSITSIGSPKSDRKYDRASDCGAFAHSPLESIDIPNSVKYIGFGAFMGCEITSIEIPDSVTCIGDSAFDSCQLETVRIPSSVKTIGEHAFASCYNLKTVYLPNSIEYIGSEAFASCKNLEFIEVNDNEPHDSTCKKGVIKNKAFNFAQYLKKIIIPNSIEVIEEGAFSTKETLWGDHYHSLNVDYFHIPASVKRIEKQDWGQSGNKIKVLDFGGEIPDTNNTFEGCVINELRVNVLRKNAIIPNDIVEAVDNCRNGRIIYAAPDLCDKQSEIPGYITVTSAKTDKLVDINTYYIVSIEPYEIERYHPLTGSLITCAASNVECKFQILAYEPREMVIHKIAESLANLGQQVGGIAGLLNQIETLCKDKMK